MTRNAWSSVRKKGMMMSSVSRAVLEGPWIKGQWVTRIQVLRLLQFFSMFVFSCIMSILLCPKKLPAIQETQGHGCH